MPEHWNPCLASMHCNYLQQLMLYLGFLQLHMPHNQTLQNFHTHLIALIACLFFRVMTSHSYFHKLTVMSCLRSLQMKLSLFQRYYWNESQFWFSQYLSYLPHCYYVLYYNLHLQIILQPLEFQYLPRFLYCLRDIFLLILSDSVSD